MFRIRKQINNFQITLGTALILNIFNLGKEDILKMHKICLSDLPTRCFVNPQLKHSIDGSVIIHEETYESLHKGDGLFKLSLNPMGNPSKSKIDLVIGHVTRKLELFISYTSSKVIIGDRVQGRWTMGLWERAECYIGDECTSNGVSIECDRNSILSIDNDCMFSSEIMLQVGDMHSLIDAETGIKINFKPSCLKIHKHCWIGRRASIMVSSKIIEIGQNTCVGMCSVVTSSLPSGVVAAGNPARVLRSGVVWSREGNNLLID